MIKAIREDENAVRSLGKNVYSYKLQSLILGGVIGAVGGVIFAISRQSVVPDSLSTTLTFFAYVALVLGGAARVLGPVVGAIVFQFVTAFIDVALRQAIDADHITFLVANEVGIVRQILVGVGLMLLMTFRPAGHHRRQAGGRGQCPALSSAARRHRTSPSCPSRVPPSPTRSSWWTASSAASVGSWRSTWITSKCNGARSPR